MEQESQRQITELKQYGPRKAGSYDGICQACGHELKEGDYTTLLALGPGPDPSQQEKAKNKEVYNAVAIELHYKCATGKEPQI